MEIVRGILAAWADGDFRTGAAHFDPEVDFQTFMPDADHAVAAHGLGELEAFTRDWLAQWQRYRIVGDEFKALGSDKVFVAVTQVAAGGQSGVEVESPGSTVWTFRDRRVVRLSLHYDKAEALEAAGLSE